MRPLRPLKASTNHKPVSCRRNLPVWIGRRLALRRGRMRFWASIRVGDPLADAGFPDPPSAFRLVFLPNPQKRLLAAERLGIEYIHDRFVCALQRSD